MAAAPAVLNLQDTIAQLRAANDPFFKQLDQQDQNVVQSGQAQVAGLDAAKTAAFSDITNNAATRGALFSGYTPNEEGKYTGNTYLPSVARLQQAITDARASIQQQRAQQESGINTEAVKQVQGSKSALEQYNIEQERAVQKAAQDAETLRQQQTFAAEQASLDRAATASAAQVKANNTATENAAARGKVATNATGGLNFFDAKGNPINAATYADLNNTSVASVLAGSKDPGDQKFVNDYNAVLEKIRAGEGTKDQGLTALRQDYAHLGNFTL